MTDPRTLTEARWLTPGVGGIGAASLLSDAGHEIPTALLPSLLTATLGAPAAALGLIEGIADGLAGVARLAGGALADHPQRRRAVAVGGYTTTAVLSSLIGAATAVWQVGLLRAGAWAARGLRVPARNALLADIVPASVYGRAYGFERAMDNLGAIAGPLLALALVGLVGTRTAIALSVIPGLLAALAIVYAIRHAPHAAERERQPLRLRIRPVLTGRLGRLLVGVSAFELGNVAATLLILRASELLAPGRSQDRATQLALGLYVAYNLAATLVSIPAGRLGDRRGAILVLALGVGLFGLSYAGFAAGPGSVLALAPWFVAAGVAIGCVETAEHAAVAALAPVELRGSAFGLLAAVQSFGNLAASAIAGLLWTAVSPRLAFGYLVAWMVLALVGLLAAGRNPPDQRPLDDRASLAGEPYPAACQERPTTPKPSPRCPVDASAWSLDMAEEPGRLTAPSQWLGADPGGRRTAAATASRPARATDRPRLGAAVPAPRLAAGHPGGRRGAGIPGRPCHSTSSTSRSQ